ncbi:MAG: hypothetical protein P4L90_11960 [Rhodopila sp.]|nr:hypothetical protein [Rhodopila sp.]
MAKRKTGHGAAKPDATDQLLIELATSALASFFFDPDQEEHYQTALSGMRQRGTARVEIAGLPIEVPEGECVLRIEALKTWTQFSVAVEHPAFSATIEGLWDFDHEELRRPQVMARTGDAAAIEGGVEAIMEALEGPDLDDEEYQDLMDALADDSEVPLIGDDPKEPPPATSLDRSRVKAIAKRLARDPEADMSIEDHGWLEQTPQTLPVITDLLVEAASATGKQRDENLVQAYQDMLARQLEFVRYRLDNGWEWAIRMLDEFQQRLIALGESKSIPQDDWFAMGAALTEARVPVSNEAQIALANAGFKTEQMAPPEALMGMVRTFLDELAGMVSSPAEVIESLKNSAAMMPANLRGFLATELSLSPHAVLRDAVPLMLLDADSVVRRDAALALEQTARPDTMSPDALRRTITARNWLPPADRPALDSVIRKSRLAGVEIGGWPAPSAGIEYHATMIDGSGAQSLLAADRSGKRGLFAGLLLRHGEGVADAWGEKDLPRRQINDLLRDAQLGGVFAQVRKSYVDAMVQHAIGTAVESGKTPSEGVLTIAELIGGADWKDRRLDIKEEAERLWGELPEADRTQQAVETAFKRGLGWMTKDQIIASWFEDGPKVREALASLPRTDKIGMAAVVMNDILPAARAQWAERFVLMAMWCQAAIDQKFRSRARDLIPVAHALVGDTPLDGIPIMGVIAGQTVRAVLTGSW